MSIPVLINTFENDGPCAVFAALSAFAAGLGPVFVEVQADKPVAPMVREHLVELGCRVREVERVRRMNMRGMDTFKGMLASYDHVFLNTGERHLLNLDSDTYVISANRMLDAVDDDVLSAASMDSGYPFAGYSCLLSLRLISALRDWLAEWGGFPGHYNANFPWDVAVGQMSRKWSETTSLGETRMWPHDPSGSYGAGWQYGKGADGMEDYIRKYDVVTFGNRHLIPGPGSDCAKRDKVAETMLEFHKLLTAA